MASDHNDNPSEHAALNRSWNRWAWFSIGGFVLLSLVLGLLVLPSRDEAGRAPFSIICRAIGIPGYGAPSPNATASTAVPVSDVSWSGTMRRTLAAANPQRGAELVKQSCGACHGENGISTDPLAIPNLAGQYNAAIFKQLRDFQSGARKSPTMNAMAKPLTEAQMEDVAAYYAGLPPAPFKAAKDAVSLAVYDLANNGSPATGNAACNACHGSNRNGPEEAPVLTGQPVPYLEQQLKNFASAARGNDMFERMRSIAQRLTPEEIQALSIYYGGVPALR